MLTAGLQKRASGVNARYIDKPAEFIKERLKAHLWSKQIEICNSVATNRHTAVRSCHGVGKSFIAARIAAWWVASRPPGEAIAVTTAPTMAQVRAILWREMRRAHAAGNLPGRMNLTEWWMSVDGTDEMVAFGRKPSEYDEAAFQGIHNRYVMAILDEAAGVPEQIWNGVETIVTNEDSRVLAIGNPDDPSSLFAQKCTPGSLYNIIHIDAFDSPNFTDEPIPDEVRPYLISPLWVEERVSEWGITSPLYESRVRGNFPENPEDAVVPMGWAIACQYDDEEERPEVNRNDKKSLGVDVGAGGDETALCMADGPRARMDDDWHQRTPDPEQAAGLVMKVVRDSWREADSDRKGIETINVDANGIGHGVVGLLRTQLRGDGELRGKVKVVPVMVSKRSKFPRDYRNIRSELWWTIGREFSRTQAWDLTDLPGACIGQLIAPKWKLGVNGQRVIEPKKDTNKRLGRSPDLADALLLAYYRAPSASDSIRV